jgi:hypothetical protein
MDIHTQLLTLRLMTPPTHRPRARRPLWKAFAFRLAAVLVGLSPLILLEVGLRALDLGRPTDTNDPFVGFSELHPLFVLNQATGRYEIPKSRQTHFRPESFAAEKQPGEFRIFVLGGSTVQGRPWAIETSFTTWLELSLSAADPERKWEVVNCGGVSYATYRLVPILEEVLQYQPDLVIFCEGHNEFLEDRSYDSVRQSPAAVSTLQRHAAGLRTYNLFRDALLSASSRQQSQAGDRQLLPPEMNARLDWQDGIDQFHRDPAWQAVVIEHFAFNLRRMVDIADRAEVPLLFVSPVSNLEWPPFKSEHRAGLSPQQREQFNHLLQQASEQYAASPAAALALLEQARAIGDQHALVHYEIGRCQRDLLRLDDAKASWIRAKDLDVCPLRMLEPMKLLINRTAAETGTPLVDAEAILAARSDSGFPDNQWLVDHCHPTIEGHQLIADAIVEKMARQKFLLPQTDWQAKRDTAYKRHLASLTTGYFELGRSFLEAEQRWAHGQMTKQPARKPQ